MDITPELVANVRNGILDLLALLADPEAQRAYERDVPLADVPSELFCGWFDDTYIPSSPAFQLAFSEEERAALANFSEQFDAIGSAFGKRPPPLDVLQTLERWKSLEHAAARTLARLVRAHD